MQFAGFTNRLWLLERSVVFEEETQMHQQITSVSDTVTPLSTRGRGPCGASLALWGCDVSKAHGENRLALGQREKTSIKGIRWLKCEGMAVWREGTRGIEWSHGGMNSRMKECVSSSVEYGLWAQWNGTHALDGGDGSVIWRKKFHRLKQDGHCDCDYGITWEGRRSDT